MGKIRILSLALACLAISRLQAQSVISARSGLVNFFEGVVFLDGQPLERKSGFFPRMREGSTLTTQSGRAEILLTPDTYMRLGESSGVRLISGSLADTQVELLTGSAVLDSTKAPEGAFVRIVFRDATIHIMKRGTYRMDAEPPQLRVYEGEAEVTRPGGAPMTLAASQLMPLDGAPVVKRFTQGSDGLLDLWSAERGALIASNLVNSQSIGDPLLDNGPGVPADLASYIGYMPLPSLVSPGASSSTYSYLYPNPYGFSPYASLTVVALAPARPAYLYMPRPVFSVYGPRPIGVGGGFSSGLGFTPPPVRPVFTPRPATPAPVVRPPIRGVGRR